LVTVISIINRVNGSDLYISQVLNAKIILIIVVIAFSSLVQIVFVLKVLFLFTIYSSQERSGMQIGYHQKGHCSVCDTNTIHHLLLDCFSALLA